eukprot:SAG11_NODE_52_length_19809_cov_14.064231_22_plen_74_part_00
MIQVHNNLKKHYYFVPPSIYSCRYLPLNLVELGSLDLEYAQAGGGARDLVVNGSGGTVLRRLECLQDPLSMAY